MKAYLIRDEEEINAKFTTSFSRWAYKCALGLGLPEWPNLIGLGECLLNHIRRTVLWQI